MGNCCNFFKKSQNQGFLVHSNKQVQSFREDDKQKEKIFVRLMRSSIDSKAIPVLDYGLPFLIFGQNKKAQNFFYYFDQRQNRLVEKKIQTGFKFLNYSGSIFIDTNRVMICGGIQHNLTNISSQCLVLDIKNMKVEKLPDMHQIRYTFSLAFKDNYVYAIGGRVYGNDNVSLLKKCERYSFQLNQWEEIADMNVNRCTSTTFIFKNQIYVFGGYSSQYKRSKKIEKYNEELNIWEILDFKLYAGFENGNVVPSQTPNKILILGGKLNYGNSKNVWEYDLIEKTVLNKTPLINNGILTKYFCDNFGNVFIFGENNDKNPFKYYVENYNINNFKTKQINVAALNSQHLEKFKQYNFTQNNIEVIYQENLQFDYSTRQYEHINILFGTDQEPFQFEVHSKTCYVQITSIPTNLKLMNFQGLTRISENELFFAGGINVSFKIIKDRCFIYNLQTREVKPVQSMSKIRYTFPLIKHKNYVYAIGGREYGADKDAIFKNCERFDLETEQWQHIGQLNKARCTSNAFIWNDKLMVAGGFCQDSKRTETIEIFDEKTQQWMMTGLQLPFPLEASVFANFGDEILCFGGRQDVKGDNGIIFKLNFQDKDFAEPIVTNIYMEQKVCLHKGFEIDNTITIFGSKKNFIQNFYKNNLHIVQKKDVCISSDLPFEVLQKRILENLELISFNEEFFTKNSYVTPF